MPGKASDSDSLRWDELALEESGGFAGLIRGARLIRARLDAREVALVDGLMARLHGAAQAGPQSYPDRMVVRLDIKSGAKSRSLQFDAADAPAALDDLLKLAPLRPLPLP